MKTAAAILAVVSAIILSAVAHSAADHIRAGQLSRVATINAILEG